MPGGMEGRTLSVTDAPMAQVQVRDRLIWTKHIHGDAVLADRLEALEAGATVRLRVAGKTGLWEKVRAAPAGAATPGLKPLERRTG